MLPGLVVSKPGQISVWMSRSDFSRAKNLLMIMLARLKSDLLGIAGIRNGKEERSAQPNSRAIWKYISDASRT
jgi:hypothetical protein